MIATLEEDQARRRERTIVEFANSSHIGKGFCTVSVDALAGQGSPMFAGQWTCSFSRFSGADRASLEKASRSPQLQANNGKDSMNEPAYDILARPCERR